MSSNQANDPLVNRFSFQHFDQESDFGIETASGERIRKKKKPGRKPNPPSIQERRAQNRAAQKAFREREQQRKEEKEKQWHEYSEEIKRLRKQLSVVNYENKYLKACVLHLTLAFLIHRGSVPHIWTESRIIPSNSHGEYKKAVFAPYGQNIDNEAYQIPALLDMILENQHVVDFDKALFMTSQYNAFMNYKKRRGVSPDLSFAHYQEYINQDVITLNRGSQEPKKNFPKKRSNSNVSSKPSTSSVSSPQVPRPPASISNSSSLSQTSEKNSVKSDGPPLNSNFSDSSSTSSVNNNQALTIQQKPIKGVLFEPPPLRTSEDFANMPTLQALHILRLQMKLGSILGSMTPASLLPTALQRVVPHDIRIDYVPGASIRDRMIIFQDYYDIDECFQYLTQQTVFLGGDVRNSRNWSVGADYSVKFWYLSHLVVDQTYNDCIDAKESQIIAEEFCNMSDTEEMPIYPPPLQQQQQDLAISDINPINFGSILLD